MASIHTNTPEQKENCPQKFSYNAFSNGYIVRSDAEHFPQSKAFLLSNMQEMLELCTSHPKCKSMICAYKQELIRALEAQDPNIDPSKLLRP